MSTAFDGEYCVVKDKMVLTDKEASELLRTLSGSSKYKCDKCGGYHVTSTKSNGLKRTKQLKARIPKPYVHEPQLGAKPKPRKKLKSRSPKNEGWWDVALEIWAERPHVCEVTGVPLGDTPHPIFFSHLIPRGSYKKFKRRKDNIRIQSPAAHKCWHDEGVEKLKDVPEWKATCDLYFQLRNEANGL